MALEWPSTISGPECAWKWTFLKLFLVGFEWPSTKALIALLTISDFKFISTAHFLEHSGAIIVQVLIKFLQYT